MKKILILVENFRVGGAQYMVYELIKNLDPKRVDFKVVCYTGRKGTALETAMEQYTKVEYLNIKGRIGPFKYLKVIRAINAYKPDLVHAHLSAQIFSIVWGALYKKPTLITGHTTPEKAFLKKTQGLLERGFKKGTHYIAAVSERNCALMREYFNISESKCFYVNNGIDINAFRLDKHEHFTFINVATHNENKNQIAILRGFAKLVPHYADIRLLLVGNGPTHEYLIEQAHILGVDDKVEFPGSVSDVENYYAKADVYVQSSHREAMPLSVLEAMAAGLPVIATNVGGLSDVVKGNGYLISDDEQELYVAMEKILLCTKEERMIMSRASKDIVKPFSSKDMAEQYMEIYESIC